MIEHISRYNNFANALRRLPRGILLMFVHSVEDLIFNMALEQRVKDRNFNSPESCGADAYGFPDLSTTVASPGRFPLGCLVGYETDESLISEYEKSAMESIGLSRESFKIRSMPEISMKGAFRPLLSPLLGLNVSGSEDCISLEFSIAAGSYATIFLNEITRTGGMELSSLLS